MQVQLLFVLQVGTWMHGFAFDAMPEEQLAAVKKELRIIIFPGSTILSKRLMGGPPPTPQPPRHMQVGTHLHWGKSGCHTTSAEVCILQLPARVQPEMCYVAFCRRLRTELLLGPRTPTRQQSQRCSCFMPTLQWPADPSPTEEQHLQLSRTINSSRCRRLLLQTPAVT
jgi:hypothetical protein